MAKVPTGSNYSESIPAITILIPNYSHTLNLCPYTNGLASLPAVNPICLQTCFSTPSQCQHLRISNQNYDHWERYLGFSMGSLCNRRLQSGFLRLYSLESCLPIYRIILVIHSSSLRGVLGMLRPSSGILTLDSGQSSDCSVTKTEMEFGEVTFRGRLCGNMFKMELKGAGRRSLYIFKQRYISLFPPC